MISTQLQPDQLTNPTLDYIMSSLPPVNYLATILNVSRSQMNSSSHQVLVSFGDHLCALQIKVYSAISASILHII